MNDVGMVASQFDPYIFIGDRVIAVGLVDDMLFWSTGETFIMALGMKLRVKISLLKEEDGAAVFLELLWIGMMKVSSN